MGILDVKTILLILHKDELPELTLLMSVVMRVDALAVLLGILMD